MAAIEEFTRRIAIGGKTIEQSKLFRWDLHINERRLGSKNLLTWTLFELLSTEKSTNNFCENNSFCTNGNLSANIYPNFIF